MKFLKRLLSWFTTYAVLACLLPAQFTAVDLTVELPQLAAIGVISTDSPVAFTHGRQITIFPTSEQLIVYVAYTALPPGAPRVSWPFMPDPRLDALPRYPTPWGEARIGWPTLRAVVGKTVGPDLFQTLTLPIPPGDYAVQTFIVRSGKGILGSLQTVR